MALASRRAPRFDRHADMRVTTWEVGLAGRRFSGVTPGIYFAGPRLRRCRQ